MKHPLTISALLEVYLNGSTTPREVLTELWPHIASSDPTIWTTPPEWQLIESFLNRLESLPTAEAKQLPLYGIPFAIKDNIDLAGVATTCGCPHFSFVPERSATIVEQLIAAGAIPIGKTNLDQFATGLVGVRSPYGVPKNPFNPDYIPGGSSSGSAVALALGLCCFSLGTDTAGSGRVPASLNHLVGLKPTRGALSTKGVFPACRTLDCPSIFAHDCDDALKVFEVVAQFDPEDPFARRWHPSPAKLLTELTIGFPKPEQLEFFGNNATASLYQQSLDRLQQLGLRLQEIDLQPFLDAASLLYEGPWVAERYAAIELLITTKPEALHPVTRQIIGQGQHGSAVDAFRAQYRLAELRRRSETAWVQVDAIVVPTIGTPYTIEEVLAEPVRLNSNLGCYTNFMNLLDLSAWAVPAGVIAESGMPWGVTFFAPAFADRQLHPLAAAFQERTQSDGVMPAPVASPIARTKSEVSPLPLPTV